MVSILEFKKDHCSKDPNTGHTKNVLIEMADQFPDVLDTTEYLCSIQISKRNAGLFNPHYFVWYSVG